MEQDSAPVEAVCRYFHTGELPDEDVGLMSLSTVGLAHDRSATYILETIVRHLKASIQIRALAFDKKGQSSQFLYDHIAILPVLRDLDSDGEYFNALGAPWESGEVQSSTKEKRACEILVRAAVRYLNDYDCTALVHDNRKHLYGIRVTENHKSDFPAPFDDPFEETYSIERDNEPPHFTEFLRDLNDAYTFEGCQTVQMSLTNLLEGRPDISKYSEEAAYLAIISHALVRPRQNRWIIHNDLLCEVAGSDLSDGFHEILVQADEPEKIKMLCRQQNQEIDDLNQKVNTLNERVDRLVHLLMQSDIDIQSQGFFKLDSGEEAFTET